ncbi:pilus assembly protein [Pseudoduganella violaceinigra]|uniref:pilus assembly protein n=1 Tax=Pseudoduganella violaceinigra TaxID=246602 RepID=UPI000404266A|nr:PilC/PilY family type IV pilus protein [Pseudoduganella violaceinigra]
MNWTNVPHSRLRALLASLGLCLIPMQVAHSGPTELADIPMANASTANILPNIMLDLDNSGSMSWDYMPDHVRYQSDGNGFSRVCRGPDGPLVCETGDAPRSASNFNGLYYNPAISYPWPLKSDGTRLADKLNNTSYVSPWSAVPSDGYGIQDVEDTSATDPASTPCTPAIIGGACPTLPPNTPMNLVTGYPERVWCDRTDSRRTCVSSLDSGNNYSYPNSTYRYRDVKKGAPFYYNVSVEWCSSTDSSGMNYGQAGTCQAKKTSTYKYVRFYNWSRVNIVSTVNSYPKAASRNDCKGATCTYAEEMANFATWYAWYRTRAQMTKSAIGLSFSDVRGVPIENNLDDANYLHARVGLTTINNPGANKINIDNFEQTQKDSFYSKLYGFDPSGGTPLRSSLMSVGEMYKGVTTTYTDPVQFACQKNYAILATDGYWNDDLASEVRGGQFVPPDAAKPDQDGDATRPAKDDLRTPNTLADVAYYYYNTDLRTSNCGTPDRCANIVSPSGSDATMDDVANYQHMTTFTIGLGVDGTLQYDANYKTAPSGDFANIKQGTLKWPAPVKNKPETIDDLWHAAVNGHGTYFSASNPAVLESSLRKALASIDSTTGAGAAAGTSSIQPTPGDDKIFTATYRTLKWDSDITAYKMDLDTGAILPTPVWQAEPLLRSRIVAAGNSDTRTIYTGNYSGTGTITRTLFNIGTGGLTAAQLALFDTSKLSQASSWSTAQSTAATPLSLLNYLRGQDRNEDQTRPNTYGPYDRLYRDREKALGDIVHSQPIFVKQPQNKYIDPDFGAYKQSLAKRKPTLYAASNDGMLHAFDADTGDERWAYIPPMMLPNLWRLADANYESKHRYYLDGPLTINDAELNGTWKTVLIGALGKGGRGYYALDVTDPEDPKTLWEFNADKNPNVGYTYGTPMITMRKDGTWVAVVASGYNNIPEDDGKGGLKYPTADGKGYVFVLDIATGKVLTTIPTNVGSVTNPSGLAWLNVRVDNFAKVNQELVAYGGDLTGVMWRFDIDAGVASQLANIGATKPITTAPEIGQIDTVGGTPLPTPVKTVYFGSGRYLGKGDLDDKDVQTLYAVRDDGKTTIRGTSGLLQATASGASGTRSVTNGGKFVDWQKDWGWYLNLIDSGERLALNPQLFFGTVLFSTTVPSISECQPGGYSWLYQLDAENGDEVTENMGGLQFTSPVVGITVSKLPNGKPIFHAVTADGKKPNPTDLQVGKPDFPPKRVLYRELNN